MNVRSVLLMPMVLGSGYAMAANQDNDARPIEEIVVTAQKREQSIQDIPAAVSVVDGDSLRTLGINDPTALTKIVPNLTSGIDRGDVNLSIRGVGRTVLGASPGIAVHIDGVYQPRSTMANLVQMDIARVEAVRGPQGTLYGRNANGGAVNYVTTSAGDEVGGFVQARYDANYNEYGIGGALNLPLGERARLRITADHSDRKDGFVEHVLGGQDLDEGENTMARLRLEVDLTDSLDLTLIGTHAKQDTSGIYFTNVSAPAPAAFGANPWLSGLTISTEPRTTTHNDPTAMEKDYNAISAALNWDINDTWSIRSVTAYQEFDFQYEADFDAVSVSGSPQLNNQEAETFTQELNFIFSTEKVSGVFGLFFMDETFDGGIDFEFALGTGPLPPGGLLNSSWSDYETDVFAVFADATWEVTDRFRVLGGIRYSQDEQEITQFNTIRAPVPPFVDPSGFVTLPFGFCDQTTDVDFDSTTFRAGVQYDLSENSTSYATYSRGFKIGGISPRTGCANEFDEETVDAYEIGIKSRLADGALTLNAAAFYYDYQDLQVEQLVGFNFELNNAPEAHVVGVEVEGVYQPDAHWTISGNLSWQESEFDEFVNGDSLNPMAGSQDLDGNPLLYSPDVTANLWVSYMTDPMIAGGPLTLQANLSYKDRVYFREFGNKADSQSAYAILDASVQWDSPDEAWTVRAFGRNLTDKEYLTSLFAGAISLNQVGFWGTPRQYGLEVRANF